ncbi:MAG: TPR end-of-group domain-containing protein [Planctomycetota bacterium JB042]
MRDLPRLDETTRRRISETADRHELDLLQLALDDGPDDFETLARLGELYTRLGRVEEGLEVDRRLARIAPSDPIVRYNLACSLALLGQPEESCAALREAVRLGYSDLEHLLQDADLASVRSHPLFADVLRLLERHRRDRR